jgi:hypothetical protein
MKIDDKVSYVDRGSGLTRIGFIRQLKVHDLNYTSFILAKVEFEFDHFEWINLIYLTKVF